MEVTALCVRLVINVMMLQHCYCAEKSDLRIVPNRLQLFEYDSISCDCEGFGDLTEWRVMRRIMGVETACDPNWKTPRTPCFIKNAFVADSGEYWCEAKGTGRSNSVNISVTAGSVILESPALPVTEGETVTLRCRNKTTSSVPIADFYKDGTPAGTGYEGNMTINNVSKSDEGIYKCKIIGGEESAESHLAVRASTFPHEERHPPRHHPFTHFITCIAVSLCLVALLSLVVGLCLCEKHRVSVCVSSKTSMQRSHSAEAGVSSLTVTAVINTPSAGTNQGTTDENTYYSTIEDI